MIRMNELCFSLLPLQAVMVPKCGYIRRAVAAATKDPSATVELDLSALPGGADAFEKAARYCYGANFEITASNAPALRCAAAFLDMHADDLPRRVDDFLSQSTLRSLSTAVAVLRSCEPLLPAADDLLRRAADAVALRICNEALFPTRSPPGWWTTELAALSPASFHKVETALRCRHADPHLLVTAASAYAELALSEVLANPAGAGDDDHRQKVESVVEVLPSGADAPIPAAFLCRLLHAAVAIEASHKTCRDLELRVAAVLDQATAPDLLAVALDAAGERVTNTDTVRRVIAAFVERHAAPESGGGRSRRASMSGGRSASELDAAGAMERVAKTVDEVAAEMATEESLAISKFVGVAGAVPEEARPSHDCLYRAVDIYLKTHPELDEIEREKVCSVMDPLRLSYQARLHASQNKRLPLQAVLSALYYDQLKLRSAATEEDDGSSAVGKARAQARADAALARENEALRSELARMRAYVSGMQQQPSKGSGSSSRASSPAPAPKKASFLGTVSRTLSRLNPFKGHHGWGKDTASSIAADGRRHSNTTHVVKPKRRRFSIS
ncbi:hypothetical protein HU200_030650 [Digitaria exilis]|uniref:NPH3 domain-containing protein n=1 Tax=Digitaria exilis TaxID=1010633 RepID=A0A835EN38_9POAL|nr:hypothetical protein HU200_030650 [Digitaria exilis]